MKISITFADLDDRRWQIVHQKVKTSYDFGAFETRLCVEFQKAGGTETRHVEIPLTDLIQLVLELGDPIHDVDLSDLAKAVLTPDALDQDDTATRPGGADQ